MFSGGDLLIVESFSGTVELPVAGTEGDSPKMNLGPSAGFANGLTFSGPDFVTDEPFSPVVELLGDGAKSEENGFCVLVGALGEDPPSGFA